MLFVFTKILTKSYSPVLGTLRHSVFEHKTLGNSLSLLFFCLVFLCLVWLSFLRCDHVHRKIWKHLVLLIVLLAFCGIGFDMVHSIFSPKSSVIGPISISSVLGAMKDVGEMLVMSLCAWYVVVLSMKEKGETVHRKSD